MTFNGKSRSGTLPECAAVQFARFHENSGLWRDGHTPPPATLASVLLPVRQDYVDALQSIDPSVGGIASISDLDDCNTNNSHSSWTLFCIWSALELFLMRLNDRAKSFGRLLQMTEVPLFHRSQRAGAGKSVGAGEKGKIVQQRDTHTTHVRMLHIR